MTDAAPSDASDSSDTRDATMPDGDGPDGASTWFTPSWNPAGCSFAQVNGSGAGVGDIPWVDCGNGLSGCRYMDPKSIPGGVNGLDQQKIGPYFPVVQTAQGTVFELSAVFGLDRVYALFDGEGRQTVAWKFSSGCGIALVNLQPDGQMALGVDHPDSDGGVAGERIVYGPRAAVIDGSAPRLDLVASDWGGSALSEFGIATFSASTMALQLVPAPQLFAWTFQGKPVRIPAAPGVSYDRAPIVVGSEIVFQRDGASDVRGIAVQRNSGTVETLYQKAVSWLDGSGSEFVWQESTVNADGGTASELWTAPLSTSAPLSARRVASLGSGPSYEAHYRGEGWYAYRLDDTTLRVIRLSDGYHVNVPAPLGFGWVTPTGVVAGEVWATIRKLSIPATLVYSFARVPLSSAGSPQP